MGGNYTYGAQVTLKDGTAVSGTVKNWNSITTSSSNLGNVLLNRYRNKPGTNNIASFFIRINNVDSYNNSGAIKSNFPLTNGHGGLTSVDGMGTLIVNSTTSGLEDLFSSGHNNTGQWYKTNHFKFILNRTPLGNSHSGSAKSISFHFYYIPASGNNTVIQNTVCTNQHFDNVNAVSTISSGSVNYSTVYKITGIPSLRPSASSTSITVSYIVDQKS